MKTLRIYLLTLAAVLGCTYAVTDIWHVAHAQTSTVGVPTSNTPFGITFAKAYYAAQNPLKAPFYNGRPGGPNAAVLSIAAENALVTQLNAASVTFDEQIDYWGWDPLTVMAQRQMYGIAWVNPGLGASPCLTTSQPGCVISAGTFSGTAPAGAILTSTLLSAYPPWPSTAPPTVIPTIVGPIISAPYYEVEGTVPAQGATATKVTGGATLNCTLTQIPNFSMFADGSMMNVWNCH